jgi:hypothetical protein
VTPGALLCAGRERPCTQGRPNVDAKPAHRALPAQLVASQPTAPTALPHSTHITQRHDVALRAWPFGAWHRPFGAWDVRQAPPAAHCRHSSTSGLTGPRVWRAPQGQHRHANAEGVHQQPSGAGVWQQVATTPGAAQLNHSVHTMPVTAAPHAARRCSTHQTPSVCCGHSHGPQPTAACTPDTCTTTTTTTTPHTQLSHAAQAWQSAGLKTAPSACVTGRACRTGTPGKCTHQGTAHTAGVTQHKHSSRWTHNGAAQQHQQQHRPPEHTRTADTGPHLQLADGEVARGKPGPVWLVPRRGAGALLATRTPCHMSVCSRPPPQTPTETCSTHFTHPALQGSTGCSTIPSSVSLQHGMAAASAFVPCCAAGAPSGEHPRRQHHRRWGTPTMQAGLSHPKVRVNMQAQPHLYHS